MLNEMPTSFVLDTSVTIARFLDDETDGYSVEVFETLKTNSALVPTIWWLEVANVLVVSLRKKRLSKLEAFNAIGQLSKLSIHTDGNTPKKAVSSIFEIALSQNLTSYDAAYLELAYEKGLPVATHDKAIRKAAKNLEIPLYLLN